MTLDTERRNFISGVGATAASTAMLATTQAFAQANQPSGAKPMAYQPKAMPFDPKSITGMSEKVLVSHYENNYVGAVKRLNAIGAQLAELDFAKAPNFVINGLKREELVASNSMILHELYFANLGGDGKASGTITGLINTHYGSSAVWEQDFRLTGMSLGGGSGWVILNYNYRDNTVHNYWAWDHTHSLAWGVPLLVMDMYEHAYAMDYGANARGYIDAFFQNINWDDVNRRAETARRS